MTTPLEKAVLEGNVKSVKSLLSSSPELSALPGTRGWSLLHKAAGKGHLPVVKLLLSTRFPPPINATTDDGDSALHLAVRNGHIDTVSALLAAGADAGIKNKAGRRAYDQAKTKELRALLHRKPSGKSGAAGDGSRPMTPPSPPGPSGSGRRRKSSGSSSGGKTGSGSRSRSRSRSKGRRSSSGSSSNRNRGRGSGSGGGSGQNHQRKK